MYLNSYTEFLICDSGYNKECTDPATSPYSQEEMEELEEIGNKIFNVYCFKTDFKRACTDFATNSLPFQLNTIAYENMEY